MTITVKFPAALEADLRRHAEAHGMATSLVVREAVALYLVQAQASAPPPSAEMLGADLFGRYGGPADLSSQRKAALAEVWGAKHGVPVDAGSVAKRRRRGNA